jgi:riboflavin kinase / FMN adenylyltransferase
MQIIHDLESAQFSGVVLTIGNFDGVHRGHQAILAAARRRAEAAGTQTVAMTFDPHPATILTPDRIPPTLTPLEEKLSLLERAGADVAVVVESRPEFFSTSADGFIRDIIVGRFHPVAVVEGPTFGFGHRRQGTVDTLRAAGPAHRFEVEIVEPVRVALGGHPDTVISSSLVRHLLQSGTVDGAGLCLGRPYALLGSVEHGAGRGRSLGFPTANLAVGSQLIPAEGVYAGCAFIRNVQAATTPQGYKLVMVEQPLQPIPAAISIGRKPTFDEQDLAVEAYLLDYAGDLYGHELRLEFLAWIRPQEKFASPELLAEAMERDAARTREVFAMHHGHG